MKAVTAESWVPGDVLPNVRRAPYWLMCLKEDGCDEQCWCRARSVFGGAMRWSPKLPVLRFNGDTT